MKPMFITDDPVRDFEMHDRKQEERLERLPLCEECKKRIDEDYYFDIHGEILHEKCAIRRYRRITPDY